MTKTVHNATQKYFEVRCSHTLAHKVGKRTDMFCELPALISVPAVIINPLADSM